MEKEGTLKNPIKLSCIGYENDKNFFGTKKDYVEKLFNIVFDKAYDNEFNEDGTHNFYDTIHVHSDKILFNLFNNLSFYHTINKQGEDQVGCFGDRFKVKISYSVERKNMVRISCSVDEDKEKNAIYAEIIGL